MADEKSIKGTLGKIAEWFQQPEVKELVNEEKKSITPKEEPVMAEERTTNDELLAKVEKMEQWMDSVEVIEEEPKQEVVEETKPEPDTSKADEIAAIRAEFAKELAEAKAQLQSQLDNVKPQGFDHNPEVESSKSADFVYRIKTDPTFRMQTDPTQRVFARANARGIKGAVDTSK